MSKDQTLIFIVNQFMANKERITASAHSVTVMVGNDSMKVNQNDVVYFNNVPITSVDGVYKDLRRELAFITYSTKEISTSYLQFLKFMKEKKGEKA